MCKRFCIDIGIKGIKGASLYEAGYKRCRTCQLFMKVDKRNCPCCGTTLRYRSSYDRIQRNKPIGERRALQVRELARY